MIPSRPEGPVSIVSPTDTAGTGANRALARPPPVRESPACGTISSRLMVSYERTKLRK